jgi:hypothetical protein
MAVLPTPGLTDEHRVVLGPARQHLHHPLDLALPADDRVELAVAGGLGEVAPELVEDRRTFSAALRRALADPGAGLAGLATRVARQQLDDLLTHLVEVRAELLQDLGGDALALADQAEQDVLGADVVVAELQRLAQRQLEHLLGTRRERDVPGGRGLAATDDLGDLLADGLERDVHRLERLRRDAFTLVDEAQQDVLGARCSCG